MTVPKLIDELECCDDGAEVRCLAQPSWPFEHTIAAVVEASDQPALLVEGQEACYGDQRLFAASGGGDA